MKESEALRRYERAVRRYDYFAKEYGEWNGGPDCTCRVGQSILDHAERSVWVALNQVLAENNPDHEQTPMRTAWPRRKRPT